MSLRLRIALAAVALGLPIVTLAAPPPVVTGIRTDVSDGKVHVTWQKLPDGERITYYRIFFSTKSILQNAGAYDDFDIAQANETDHVLSGAPAAAALYVSILAVNDRGEESPYFAEEARADLAPSAPSMQQTPATASANDAFQLLDGQAISSTGILLNFTHKVRLDTEHAATAFVIQNGSGETLSVTRIILSGSTVILHTLLQTPGMVYQLQAEEIVGQRQDGVLLPIDATQSTLLFQGFQEQMEQSSSKATASSAPSSAAAVVEAPEIVHLQQRAVQEEDGTYTIEVTWEIGGDPAQVAGVRLFQTSDHGVTFGDPQDLPGSTGGVRVPHVPGGEIGTKVQVVLKDGSFSLGQMDFLMLSENGGVPTPPSPLAGSVVTAPPTPPASDLTESGMSLIFLIAFAGALAGVITMRRTYWKAA